MRPSEPREVCLFGWRYATNYRLNPDSMDSHADAVESEKFDPCKQQMILETQNIGHKSMRESILTTILVKAEGGEILQAATFNHYNKIR